MQHSAARMRLRKKLPAAAAIAAAAAAAVFVFQWVNLWGVPEYLDHKAYDALFYARAKTFPPQTPDPAAVVVVGVDDATFNHPEFAKRPRTLWHDFFAEVIVGLSRTGVRSIGLDFLLPQKSFDEVVEGYSRTWIKALFMAKRNGSPVVTGVMDKGGSRITPEAKYLQIIGPDNIGLFNLTTDSDDFIRRQRLRFPTQQDEKSLYSLAWLLARDYDPQLKLPADVVYIDFNAGPRPFIRVSFSEIWERVRDKDSQYLNDLFAGRVALIGETDTITQDRRPTPLYYLREEGLKGTPGVEIHAHTINTLLRGEFFEQTPAGFDLGLYLALALAASLSTLFLSPRLPLPWSAAALIFGIVGGSFYAYIHYLILPAAGGLLALLLSGGGSFAFRHWVVDREKREVKTAFSRYLSPDVVNRVLDDPEMLSLGGSRRVMTVFFSDLAGFTSISEKMKPEDLVGLLNRYLSLVTRNIMDRGGTVDKFEGDAVMAFWGAPLRQEDHALRACLSALDQQKLAAEFREELRRENLPEVKVRMGLNTGPMIVGNMGSQERFDYTVMGDAVNLASRLEGANKPYGTYIMISESTYEEVKTRVEVRELDLLQVKGKSEPIRVYELLAEKGRLPEGLAPVLEAYRQGLKLYRDRRFEAAEAAFGRALEIDPDDGPSRTYLERCRRYQESPPPEDWDRVFTMETK